MWGVISRKDHFWVRNVSLKVFQQKLENTHRNVKQMFSTKKKPSGLKHAFRGCSKMHVQQDPRLQRFKYKLRNSLKFITKQCSKNKARTIF